MEGSTCSRRKRPCIFVPTAPSRGPSRPSRLETCRRRTSRQASPAHVSSSVSVLCALPNSYCGRRIDWRAAGSISLITIPPKRPFASLGTGPCDREAGGGDAIRSRRSQRAGGDKEGHAAGSSSPWLRIRPRTSPFANWLCASRLSMSGSFSRLRSCHRQMILRSQLNEAFTGSTSVTE